jgi:DTW domain-containing protein
MRSSTTSDLPGRCKRCWVRLEFCVCGDAVPVHPRTELVVVRHIRESWKSTGTARAASLTLPSLTCLDYHEDAQPALGALDALAQPGTFVLFPKEPTADWHGEPVKRLIVLDGTWRQTRRMFQRLPPLHALPRLALSAKREPVLRLREGALAEGRSTLEAIADALEVLEGPSVSTPLHAFHRLFVERILRARGVWEQRTNPAGG